MNIVSAVILCTIVGAIGAVVLVLAAKFMAAAALGPPGAHLSQGTPSITTAFA